MNPALINCCTIDWFDEWDREAMLSVARVYFQGASFVAEKEEDIPVSITKLFLLSMVLQLGYIVIPLVEHFEILFTIKCYINDK